MHNSATNTSTAIKSTKSIVLKIITVVVCVIIFALTVRSKYIYFYKNLHLLTHQEVATIIANKISFSSNNNREINTKYASRVSYVYSDKKIFCKNIKTCDLHNGDILIRRYVTDKTKLLDSVLHPYYTHTAFYTGEGDIVEAIGNESNKQDEILKEKINMSDWYDSEIPSFVILRPKYDKETLIQINNELTDIANNNKYAFGLPSDGIKDNKKTYCSYLIYDELIRHTVITDVDHNSKNKYPLISPDYLFSILMSSTSTAVVGYDF